MIGTGVTVSSGDHDYQIRVDPGFSISIVGLAFKKSMLTKSDFILVSGNLVLDHAIISDNNIGPDNNLINNNNGRLTITYSIISNNIGRIYNTGNQLTITNSIISNTNRNNPDKTSGSLCPIYNEDDGSLTIRDSTIADNISNFNCGGIYNAGQLTIIGSTISGNSTPSIPGSGTRHYGGGITNEGGTLKIMNSTIAGNTAGRNGGGIVNLSGNTIISFCTIYGNSASAGAGIAVKAGTVTMSNSIVAGNNLISGEQPSHPNIAGDLISKGFNLIQNMANIALQHTSAPDTSNIAVSRFTPVDDITVSAVDLANIFDPQGLQYNGGPTRTYALRPLSNNPVLGRIPPRILLHPSYP